jgi:hypothetical protein
MQMMGGEDLLNWAKDARIGDSIVYARSSAAGERLPSDVVNVVSSLAAHGALHPTQRRVGDGWAFQAQRGSGKISRVTVRRPSRGGTRGLPANRASERAVFKRIEAAAKHGLPCPTNAELARLCGLSGAIAASYRVRRLVASGRISIIDKSPYGRRIATLLVGRHAGKSTQEAAL